MILGGTAWHYTAAAYSTTCANVISGSVGIAGLSGTIAGNSTLTSAHTAVTNSSFTHASGTTDIRGKSCIAGTAGTAGRI